MPENKKQEVEGFLESMEEQPRAMDIFSNEQVYVHEVPTIATLEYSGLEPAYRNVSLISSTILYSIIVMVLLAFTRYGVGVVQQFGSWMIAAALLLWAVSLLLIFLGFKKKSYAVRERDLVYNEGLIWHSSTVIPFNRVQHCEISQGPIERLFELSELKVYTAGGASSDMSIPGLRPDNANRLKEFIVLNTGLYIEEEE